jgi:hypothetical protein
MDSIGVVLDRQDFNSYCVLPYGGLKMRYTPKQIIILAYLSAFGGCLTAGGMPIDKENEVVVTP